LDRRGAELIEERRVELGRVVTVDGSVRARQATLALEIARDAAGELLDQIGDVGIGERRGGLEARRSSRSTKRGRRWPESGSRARSRKVSTCASSTWWSAPRSGLRRRRTWISLRSCMRSHGLSAATRGCGLFRNCR
jgi:hypothetical protein